MPDSPKGENSSARITRSTLTLPGALPATDPLPHPSEFIEAGFTLAADLPAQIHERSQLDWPRTMHPSLLQSHYGRELGCLTLDTVVVENGALRAEVLPSLGGRLWSLRDLSSGRELLYANQAIQPANLGLLNAWFAGGVEWNIGTKGHSAHTMSPVHTGLIDGAQTPDGVPRLRLWERDRLRGVVFQVDMWLPEGAAGLHVYVRIQNPGPCAVPMYWWSNMAVPEADDVRVLAPAVSAFATEPDGPVRRVPIPVHDGTDVTWPTRSKVSADYFYDIADDDLPWVAAVGSDGHGLLQASTGQLRGRKMFCWGTSAGGSHWQDWLSPRGGSYLEIQAGLLPTQFEHVMMPAGTHWDWVEVYGDADVDAGIVHSDNWQAATAHVAAAAARLLPDPEQALFQGRSCADSVPERLTTGTGWSAVEVAAAQLTADIHAFSAGTPFPDVDGEPSLWSKVLTDPSEAAAVFAAQDPGDPPLGYLGGPGWEQALRELSPSWLRDYHLGVLAHARGNLDLAEHNYLASLDQAQTAWATRGLALLAVDSGAGERALGLFRTAWQHVVGTVAQSPEHTRAALSLLVETMTAALVAEQPDVALTVAEQAPDDLRQQGRVRLLRARAGWLVGTEAGRELTRFLLTDGIVVPDLREGERELSDLWLAVFPGEPVPPQYDYRMF